MKVLDYNVYLDGGTILITTNDGTYSYDNRISSTTKGKLYLGYPRGDDSNIVIDSDEIEEKIIDALKDYKNLLYDASIEDLIKNKNILLKI